jgi:ethanolamine utilization protein EutN
MILGRVMGEVWATRKHAAYDGRKLLIVKPLLAYDGFANGQLVAVDTVQAGPGDDVVVCLGTPARRALGGTNLPVEATICAVVDRVTVAEDVGRRPLRWLATPRSLGDDA